MLANKSFSDLFSFHATGLEASVYPAASTAGTAFQFKEFRKLTWLLNVGAAGSGNTTLQLLLQYCATSNGTFSTYDSLSSVLTASLAASVGGGSMTAAYIDTRGEALYGGAGSVQGGIGGQSLTAPIWVRAVLSLANSTWTVGVQALGWNHGEESASYYNTANYVSTGSHIYY